jgi:hypothetical protein
MISAETGINSHKPDSRLVAQARPRALTIFSSSGGQAISAFVPDIMLSGVYVTFLL